MRTSSCMKSGCTYAQFSEHMDHTAPFRVTVTVHSTWFWGLELHIFRVYKESCVTSLLDPLHFRSLQ